MKGHYKKLFSVAAALLVGVGVILFAWKGGSLFSTEVSNETTSDGWKDSLSIVPQNSPSQILAARSGGFVDMKNAGATTTTDVLARNLLTNYAIVQRGMSTTTWSDADAFAFAQTLVDKVNLPQGVQYTTKDIRISSNNTPAAITEYFNEISKIFISSVSSQTKRDTEIVLASPGSNDQERKAEITKLIARYEKLLEDLLAVQAPSDIAPLHVRLVQGYANIGESIKIIPEIFTDPMKGFTALTQYKKEVEGLLILTKEYEAFLPKTP